MTYIEAPERPWLLMQPSIFLAGGITDCYDWQRDAAAQIADASSGRHPTTVPLTVFNPRRANFPIDDPTAAEEQIMWEFDCLAAATVILFWFPESPSPQPIALYELGRHLALESEVVVGADPNYSRVQDVAIQTALVGSTTNIIFSNLSDTVNEAIRRAMALTTTNLPKR